MTVQHFRNLIKVVSKCQKREAQNHINTVSAWVLISLSNNNLAIFSVPQALKNLISPRRLTKRPDNSHVLHIF